jgi:hypothetical protein
MDACAAQHPHIPKREAALKAAQCCDGASVSPQSLSIEWVADENPSASSMNSNKYPDRSRPAYVTLAPHCSCLW